VSANQPVIIKIVPGDSDDRSSSIWSLRLISVSRSRHLGIRDAHKTAGKNFLGISANEISNRFAANLARERGLIVFVRCLTTGSEINLSFSLNRKLLKRATGSAPLNGILFEIQHLIDSTRVINIYTSIASVGSACCVLLEEENGTRGRIRRCRRARPSSERAVDGLCFNVFKHKPSSSQNGLTLCFSLRGNLYGTTFAS